LTQLLESGFFLSLNHEKMKKQNQNPPSQVSTFDLLASRRYTAASFSLGMGPVTWVVTSEIFPLSVRSKGVAFSMATNRLTSGTVAMTFLSLSAWVGVGWGSTS
jgi:hypothetical protein